MEEKEYIRIKRRNLQIAIQVMKQIHGLSFEDNDKIVSLVYMLTAEMKKSEGEKEETADG